MQLLSPPDLILAIGRFVAKARQNPNLDELAIENCVDVELSRMLKYLQDHRPNFELEYALIVISARLNFLSIQPITTTDLILLHWLPIPEFDRAVFCLLIRNFLEIAPDDLSYILTNVETNTRDLMDLIKYRKGLLHYRGQTTPILDLICQTKRFDLIPYLGIDPVWLEYSDSLGMLPCLYYKLHCEPSDPHIYRLLQPTWSVAHHQHYLPADQKLVETIMVLQQIDSVWNIVPTELVLLIIRLTMQSDLYIKY